jgi:hypothetical protein
MSATEITRTVTPCGLNAIEYNLKEQCGLFDGTGCYYLRGPQLKETFKANFRALKDD